MIRATDVYKYSIRHDKRDYREKATIRLAYGNYDPFVVTNEDLWDSGFTIEDAVSADNTFQIGAAIVNKATLVLNNIYGKFNYPGRDVPHDFNLAQVDLDIGIAAEVDIDTKILPAPSAANGWVNGYLNDSGTIVQPSSTYREKTSDFVPVDGGREYTITFNYSSTPSAYAWVEITTYNRNRVRLNNYTYTAQATGADVSYTKELNLNVAYVRVSIRTFDMLSKLRMDETSLPEYYRKGKYIVNSATYNGSLITLECYDYMCKFDFPYQTSLEFWPATPFNIINDICNQCSVSLGTNYFPHSRDITLSEPDGDKLTYRDVISCVAQICGCYARVNPLGMLELAWYDQEALENATPVEYDDESSSSGSLDDEEIIIIEDGTDGNDSPVVPDLAYHQIDSIYGKNVSVEDVTITGLKIVVDLDDQENPTATYTRGTNGYVIKIEHNPLITEDNAETIADWLWEQLGGFSFRKANITHGSDPSIEAGDVAIVVNPDGKFYRIIVSKTIFAVGRSQTTVSAAETPARNVSSRYSAETKNEVTIRKLIHKNKTEWEQAYEDLSRALASTTGLYTTVETDSSGAQIFYMHDKRDLSRSTIVWKMTAEGWGVSTDGGTTWNGGMTVNGDVIARILSASGINADWIKSGAIQIKDSNNRETFYANTANGVVRINATSFSLSGTSLADYTNNAIQSGVQRRNGTCYTHADTQEKIVHCSGFTLYDGAQITVKFTNANEVNYPQLNVNDTGRIPIRIAGNAILASGPYNWTANSYVTFVYDGEYWQVVDSAALQKLYNLDTSLDQVSVFNRLTNNGVTQGIYLEKETLFINASYINSGVLSISDTSGTETFYADTKTGVVRINATQFSLKGQTIEDKATAATQTAIGAQYGTCSTAGSTAAKVVTSSNFKLFTGARISVYFTYANTAANPTLNVNGTGAKSIRAYGGALTANSPYNWIAKTDVEFVYSGTYWHMVDSSALGNLQAFNESLGQQEVFNRLTNNGAAQGVYLDGNNLYINAEYIQSGTLSANIVRGGILRIGGNSSGDSAYKGGILQMHLNNAAQTRFARMDANGFYFGNIASKLTNPNFKIDTDGACTAKSFTASDYIRVDGNNNSYFKIPIGTAGSSRGYTEMSSTGLVISHNSGAMKGYLSNQSWRTPKSGEPMPDTGTPDWFIQRIIYPILFGINSAESRYVAIGRDGFYVSSDNHDSFGNELRYDGLSIYSYGGQNVLSASSSAMQVRVLDFVVSGSKSRQSNTEDYGKRLFYCYETPTPYFGDIGDGVIGEDGYCYVTVDPVFAESVSLNNYQVFLQKYGEGDCYVMERKTGYFVVKGTPNMAFGWEIKAKQSGYDQRRMDIDRNADGEPEVEKIDYGGEAVEYLINLKNERTGEVA